MSRLTNPASHASRNTTRKAIVATAEPKALVVHRQPGESPVQSTETRQDESIGERHAWYTLYPELNAAAIAEAFSVHDKPDINAMVKTLRERTDAMVDGKTKGIERMLWAQAHALDAMFASLARRAKSQSTVATYEAHMRYALRSQAQCRATLETLAAIKNPPVVFARQANIAHGHQQVNNGTVEPVARAEEIEIKQSELLEHDNGKQRLDTGTTGAASGTDPAMAAVETIHRPTNARRKGQGKP